MGSVQHLRSSGFASLLSVITCEPFGNMQQHSKYGRTAPAVTVSMQQLNSSWLLPCPCLPVRRQLFSSRPRPAPAAPPIPHWTQQSRPEVPPHLEHTVHRCPASSADAFSSPQPVPDDEPPVLSTIFPRVRERDPYRWPSFMYLFASAPVQASGQQGTFAPPRS